MNSELARAFDRIADLLQICGGDSFRITSYRRVGRIIGDLTDDVRVLREAGVLREVKGIGKGTAAKIEEYVEVHFRNELLLLWIQVLDFHSGASEGRKNAEGGPMPIPIC